MNNSDSLANLERLLSPYLDIQLSIFELMREKLPQGITFECGNSAPANAYEFLIIKEGGLISEYDFFYTIGNVTQNYRPYIHKLLLFENNAHQYELTIFNECESRTYLKPRMEWDEWMKNLSLPANAKITIKEFKLGPYWDVVLKHSFFQDGTYFQHLSDSFKAEWHHTKLTYLNRWFKDLNIKVKITTANAEQTINSIDLANISNDLYYLTCLKKNPNLEYLNKNYLGICRPLREMLKFLQSQ